MNYGISPDQAGKIVDRLANARNNPITAPSEPTMPSNGQFFNMSEMAAPVDFMNDPRYQPIQSTQQMYTPTIEQPQAQEDQFAKFGAFGDFFRLLSNSGGVAPNGQFVNRNVSK
jgi:hypothetical protein